MMRDGSFIAMASRYSYSDKDTAKAEYGRIQCSLKCYNFTLEDWSRCIRNGHPVRPSVLDGGRRAEHFKLAWVLGADFDNKHESIDENGVKHERALHDGEIGYLYRTKALARCHDYGITPMLAYSSLSDLPKWSRYRLMFLLNEPIESIGEFDAVMVGLRNLFPESDPACVNPDRFYLGSNGEVFDLWRRDSFEPTDPNLIKRIESWDGGAVAAAIAERMGKQPPKNRRGFQARETNWSRIKAASKKRRRESLGADEVHVDSLDLLGMLERDAGTVTRVTQKYVTFETCPICGHHDCLVYKREKNRWQCYSSSHDNGGNIAAWVADRDGITYKEAKTRLGESIG